MEKYNLIPAQLIYEGSIRAENIFSPAPVREEDLLLAHRREYWDRLSSGSLSTSEMRRTGFPWSERLITRERIIMGGTTEASRLALQYGISMNVSGGTHHAHSGKGEGFCLLNDIAIAAKMLLRGNLCRKILVVDLDVHQGDGTAEILKDEEKAFTFSMHCEENFPLVKERSDLDIALPRGMDDAAYLRLMQETLFRLLDEIEPDFIFYLSGVDVLATDKLGKLALSRAGCKKRDEIVLKAAKQNRVPVAVSLGGGYSENLRDIVEAHCNTFRAALEIFF